MKAPAGRKGGFVGSTGGYEFQDLGGRNGLADEVALNFRVAFGLDPGQLLDGFHAFSRRCHSQALGKSRNGTDDVQGVCVVNDLADE